MLLHNHAYSYVSLALTVIIIFLILLASNTHTTASFFHRHGQAQTSQLPTILALTPTNSPSYTALLLANLPAHIYALPLPNASLIDERAYPQGNHRHLSPTDRLAWRAHMDAMQYIIAKNLNIALVISSDLASSENLLQRVEQGDWDVTFLTNTTEGFAYAVTQSGARKIMYEHGIRNFDREFRAALGEWCRGETRNMGEKPRCVDGLQGKMVDRKTVV
ncbi:hypothetical protein HBI81_001800 [Parastagonospora nodorum]|nr:hypothetical protein HBH52_055760 [Parastagonospora nodorum]KAH4055062.1 hypothetical protein HBH49_070880 [Parastagonospora nodorum]KAH4175612.1 hypothetical protein HBH43_064710 [Parastagonospora nodorum]KAH4858487.1 hypothetical protein HBH75_049700 [Parastagonospora nodorum]KAH4989877.1 hypothetical protein HBI76_068820 [Parastagonospora nodorum]